jgi:hypothetical protein
MAMMRSTSAGSKVAPRPIGIGKCVPFGAARPCSASSWNMTGIPRRVDSAYFCTAFTNSACWRGSRVVGGPSGPGPVDSEGRAICPRPCGITAFAFSAEKVPASS